MHSKLDIGQRGVRNSRKLKIHQCRINIYFFWITKSLFICTQKQVCEFLGFPLIAWCILAWSRVVFKVTFWIWLTSFRGVFWFKHLVNILPTCLLCDDEAQKVFKEWPSVPREPTSSASTQCVWETKRLIERQIHRTHWLKAKVKLEATGVITFHLK